MTELIINNTRAVLPQDIAITVFEENPVLTKNGEFTLDITLSLMNDVNARIFKHINRLNAVNVLDEIDAVLIIDNKISKGKIIDFKTTDQSVTFQYVAGNSELNYFIGKDKKIWEFDWGTEAAITVSAAIDSIESPVYTNKFVCVPVKFNNVIVNNCQYSEGFTGTPPAIDDVLNIVMQPYLMYYIEKLPELLGYELADNILVDDELATQLFLTNRIRSLRYADALPDILISEFIDAIQDFFSVLFVVDKQKKCHIVKVDDFIENMDVIKLEEVLDAWERENIQGSEISGHDGVFYELGNIGYQKYQKLNDDVVNKCEVINYANSSSMRLGIIQDQLNKLIIHKTLNNNKEYVFADVAFQQNCYRTLIPATSGYCFAVNKLKDVIGDNPLELKIKPLSYAYNEVGIIYQSSTGNVRYKPVQIPFVNSDLFIPENQSITSLIEDSVKNIPRPAALEVGIYSGMVKFWNYEEFPDVLYPMSYIDDFPEFGLPTVYLNHVNESTFEGSLNSWIIGDYQNVCNKTLRLTGTNGIFERYHYDNKIDFSKLFTFIVLDDVDVNHIYHFNGSDYIPVSIEKTATIKGILQSKKVKLYKIN